MLRAAAPKESVCVVVARVLGNGCGPCSVDRTGGSGAKRSNMLSMSPFARRAQLQLMAAGRVIAKYVRRFFERKWSRRLTRVNCADVCSACGPDNDSLGTECRRTVTFPPSTRDSSTRRRSALRTFERRESCAISTLRWIHTCFSLKPSRPHASLERCFRHTWPQPASVVTAHQRGLDLQTPVAPLTRQKTPRWWSTGGRTAGLVWGPSAAASMCPHRLDDLKPWSLEWEQHSRQGDVHATLIFKVFRKMLTPARWTQLCCPAAATLGEVKLTTIWRHERFEKFWAKSDRATASRRG